MYTYTDFIFTRTKKIQYIYICQFQNETPNYLNLFFWSRFINFQKPEAQPGDKATALKATNLEGMDWNLTRKSSSDPFVRLGWGRRMGTKHWGEPAGKGDLDPRKMNGWNPPKSEGLEDVSPFPRVYFQVQNVSFRSCREFFWGKT